MQNLYFMTEYTITRGTQVAKMISRQMQPFYFIGPKMIFRSSLQHFVNLSHVKRCKHVFQD
jgi:CO dehydrogenase/acetyl-CoA synthase epsilon subunit